MVPTNALTHQWLISTIKYRISELDVPSKQDIRDDQAGERARNRTGLPQTSNARLTSG